MTRSTDPRSRASATVRAADPDIFDAPSPSSQAAQIVRFEREDWTRLRTVQGLQQRAGVPAHLLRRLVLKELADNALDEGTVEVGWLPDGGYYVEDDGSGFDGTPEDIARMFSINRPLVSTKLWRLPTRGAQGNGLRVVAGSVFASNGSLAVTTRGRRIELRPEHDGTTSVVSVTPVDGQVGTKVEIWFGPAVPEDGEAVSWAEVAQEMDRGDGYQGKSSPFWYAADDFHALLLASNATVRDMVLNLEGCARKAGEIVEEAGLGRVACRQITRDQSDALLTAARRHARPVTPKRLGAVGEDESFDGYATASGEVTFGIGPLRAMIPFTVEAWAARCSGMSLTVCVNRSPASAEVFAHHDGRDINLFGCGLGDTVAKAPKGKDFAIRLNITTPFMPSTSDSKEPNLRPYLEAVSGAVKKAISKSRNPNATGVSQKDVVLAHLDEVIALVSGEEGYRFNARQLFYALRPIVMEETDQELKIGNFTGILTDYEAANGEIPLMYREPRGSITHPHRDETITLGTLMVEQYERPEWTFSKLLYIEKEGALEALKQNRWAERHDCAVMSSKGFSTRAARDLIDKLAEHDEPVEVFCVHDADASGSMIYQTLQEETRARGARSIQIVNLGLEPWEAVAMGLEVETVEAGRQRKSVADYVYEHDEADEDWAEWLQTQRVELNAMTTPDLIAWLDEKMANRGGKLIPPDEVLEREFAERIEGKVRDAITDRILREADLEGQVAAAVARIETPSADRLRRETAAMFEETADSEWRDLIEEAAARAIRDQLEQGR
jgi:hypothetical protein